MTPYGDNVAAILRALGECGPMTAIEIMREIKKDRYRVSGVLTRMRMPTKTLPKRIYIKAYTYDDEEGRRYPRAIFDIGDSPDAKRPKESHKVTRRRYDERRRLRNRTTSVFNLALTRNEYRM
jgi:hypothetical protein